VGPTLAIRGIVSCAGEPSLTAERNQLLKDAVLAAKAAQAANR
jgi:hypothetical protein